jgi:hypothetical protein
MNLQLNSLPFSKGLFGTLTRQTSRYMILYGMYFAWFEHESKKEIIEGTRIRHHNEDPMAYRKGRDKN